LKLPSKIIKILIDINLNFILPMKKQIVLIAIVSALIISCSKNSSLQNQTQTAPKSNEKTEVNEKELLRKVVYFDTNSFKVNKENALAIKAIKAQIAKNAKFTIVAEGHCDERGSDKYNFRLGKQRALMAKKLLEKSGVPKNKISAISFGESKPVDSASNEEAWAKNRRVEIIVLK